MATNMKDLLLSTMTKEERNEFNNMTPEEQELMISGFTDCVQEYIQEATKQQPKGPQGPQGPQGPIVDPPPPPEDDGLRHWKKKMKGGDSCQNGPADPRKTIDVDQGLDTDDHEGEGFPLPSENDTNQMDAQDAANAAQQAADAAQKSADNAQDAANVAQQAADAAQQAAENSNSSSAQKNAQQAQQAADAAQQAANAAQQAASAAQQSASRAQQAASQGNEQGAQQAARDAISQASEAQKEAKKAKSAAKSARSDAKDAQEEESQAFKDAIKAHDNQNTGSEITVKDQERKSGNSGKSSASENLGEEISEVKIGNGDFGFDGGDMSSDDGKDLTKIMDELAREAGQPLSSDDYKDPIEEAKRKWGEVEPVIQNTPCTQKGDGNSLRDLTEKINELFKTTINWQTLLKKMFNDRTKTDTIKVMAKRRMGVDAGHPLYKGRYQHPNIAKFEKLDGLVQVFFLIDNSGSMGFDSAEGQKNLKHLFSEIIGLEKATHIRKSAIAYFAAGPIAKESIRTWTDKDCNNKEKLLNTICRHYGDQQGGTSLDVALESIIRIGKPYYSNQKPETLMIVVTDGYDEYGFINRLTLKQKLTTVFLIMCAEKANLENTEKALVELGIPARHILLVNTNDWDY